jgi:iron complex outermembrane recepter protein
MPVLPTMRSCTAAGLAAALGVAPLSAAAEPTVLETIHVESTTIDDRFEARRDEPSSTAVISGERVDESHVEHIQQVLQAVPGITTELQAGDSLKIHIRGVENQRYMGEKPGVAIVIDGVPVFERTGRVNIDLDNIASINVIKGGASYLFGEDALAGAVIITTKRGAGMAGYRLAGEAGSHGFRKGLARAGHAGENFNAHVQVSRRQSDGWHFNSDYKADYVNGKLQYYLSDVSDITLGVELSDRDKDSHGAVRGFTQAEEDPRAFEGRDYARMYDVQLGKYFVTYSRDVGAASNFMANAYYFTDDTDFVTAPQRFDAEGNPVTDPDAYTIGNDYYQVQRGVKSEWRTGGERFAWLAGLDLRANYYENRSHYLVDFKGSPAPMAPVFLAGTQTADDRTDEYVYAGYGELRWRLAPRWVATLNGRYDHIALDYTDQLTGLELDESFDVTSWRAGLSFDATPNLVLFGSASTGFRTPTIHQLFAGSIDPFGTTANNPDLEPEHSLNLELGLRTRLSLLGRAHAAEASVFQLDRRDFILASAGQYANPEEGAENRWENIGGARNRGFELALRSEPARVWWELAYTHLDARFTRYDNFNLILGNSRGSFVADCALLVQPDRQWCIQRFDNAGNYIPRAPRHTVNFQLHTNPLPGWVVSGEMHAISSYFADELNRIRIGGHTVFNLLTSYDVKVGTRSSWRVFGRVDNVFDRRYFNTARAHGDTNFDGVFDEEDVSIVVNPGRVWTAGISVTF